MYTSNMSSNAQRSHLKVVSSQTELPEEGKRQILAIMFSDIKGYSSMMGKDENLAFELLDDHNQLVVPQIEAHEGKILKFIGDAVLASFDSAVQASVCALSIQEAFYERNKHRNLKEKIWIRIGIHVGDVLVKNNDVFGDGVNVAARLEGLAEPGGIVISSTVRDVILANPKIQLESMGSLDLKNIQYPVNGYRILTPASGNPFFRRILHYTRNTSSSVGKFFSTSWTITKYCFYFSLLFVAYWAVFDDKKRDKVTKVTSRNVKSEISKMKSELRKNLENAGVDVEAIKERAKSKDLAKVGTVLTYGSSNENQNDSVGTNSKLKKLNNTNDPESNTINIQLKDTPASICFKSLCSLAGVQCMIDDSVTGTLSLNYNDVPLSEVFDDLASLNRFSIQKTKSGRYIIQGSGNTPN